MDYIRAVIENINVMFSMEHILVMPGDLTIMP
jgi:hypothetical protein